MAQLHQQITTKQDELEKHKKIAAQYETFKAQVASLEAELLTLLKLLPESKEIPDLIRQISDLGVRTGLQINLIRPQPEQRKEFYAEVPITVRVKGSYHAAARFFDALARLPRVVSVNDVQIEANTQETQCLATTYRFLDEEEVNEAARAKKPTKTPKKATEEASDDTGTGKKKISRGWLPIVSAPVASLSPARCRTYRQAVWAQEQPARANPPPQMRPDTRLAPDTHVNGTAIRQGVNRKSQRKSISIRARAVVTRWNHWSRKNLLTPWSPLEPRKAGPLGPLERFDMSALKLVGIVWGNLGRRALVKAPDGKGYFVTVNTYMGKYSGKIVAIEEDYMVVEELYKNLEEKIVPKTLTIPLRRKDKKEG